MMLLVARSEMRDSKVRGIDNFSSDHCDHPAQPAASPDAHKGSEGAEKFEEMGAISEGSNPPRSPLKALRTSHRG